MAKLNGVQTVDMVGGEVTKIAYDGAEYAKVAGGKAMDGDLVTFPNDAYDITNENIFITGKVFYEITSLAVYFKNDRGGDCGIDSLNANKAGGPTLFRKLPTDSPTTTDRLDSLETRVTALEDTESSVKVIEGLPQVGDKIRIIDAGISFGDYENGDILTVCRVRNEDGDIDFDDTSAQVFRNEFEIIERPKEEAKPKFSVGDYAKVVGNTCYGDIFKGTIVKVVPKGTGIDKDYGIELLDGTDFDYAQLESLEKVSEEEAKKAEAHAEKVAKFASIGRKVDDYKVGDIVEVTEDHAKASRNKAGDIGYVEEIPDFGGANVQVKSRNTPGANGNHQVTDSIKLITPVEHRFDK